MMNCFVKCNKKKTIEKRKNETTTVAAGLVKILWLFCLIYAVVGSIIITVGIGNSKCVHTITIDNLIKKILSY